MSISWHSPSDKNLHYFILQCCMIFLSALDGFSSERSIADHFSCNISNKPLHLSG